MKLTKITGGSMVLVLTMNDDLGGVTLDDVSFIVYANGILVPPAAIKRLAAADVAGGSERRRLEEVVIPPPVDTSNNNAFLQIGSLLSSTPYMFNVAVKSEFGRTDVYSVNENAETDKPTVPEAPIPPVIVSITGGAVSLKWVDPIDTGGLPLTSYTVTVKNEDLTQTCSGLRLSCEIGNLQPWTDYTVTLIAYNALGASLPSAPITATTTMETLPQPPQSVEIISVTDVSATLQWAPSKDLGGYAAEKYVVSVTEVVNASYLLTQEVGMDKLTTTIQNLQADTEYIVFVYVMTTDAQEGSESKHVKVRTLQLPGQPLPPAIGCASSSIVTIQWTALLAGAKAYRLLRDDTTLVYSGAELFAEDTSVVLGSTYAYTIVAIFSDNSRSTSSDPVYHTVEDHGGATHLACTREEGVIRYRNYPHLSSRQWTIAVPSSISSASVILGISLFALECDHDTISIQVDGVDFWRGGCRRQGDFTLETEAGVQEVLISFASDASVAYAGFEMSYEVEEVQSNPEFIEVPCPSTFGKVCSSRGACYLGKCMCFGGYVGEDCSNLYLCPKDRSGCNQDECNPVCLIPDSDIIAVSEYGDDSQGTGEIMDTSFESGTTPKAFQSIRVALQRVKPQQIIMVYPGTYSGVDNCGLTIAVDGITVRGLKGPISTVIDCNDALRGFTVRAPSVTLIGFTIRRTIDTNGAALYVVDSDMSVEDVLFQTNRATQNGGAVYALRSHLNFTHSFLESNSAVKGGSLFSDESTVVFSDGGIANSTAVDGGGVYSQGKSTLMGVFLMNNQVTARGGGIFVTGDGVLENVGLFANVAEIGGGIAVETGSVTMNSVSVRRCQAAQHGGGIAMLSKASAFGAGLIVEQAIAEKYGGGLYILSNGTISFDDATVSNCAGARGGGVYLEYSSAKISGLTISSNGATELGGGIAVKFSRATLRNLKMSYCAADRGAALAVLDRSNLRVEGTQITQCTASSFGGGVYVSSSALTGDDFFVTDNFASDGTGGGGVAITGSSALTQITVERCGAADGGGIYALAPASVQLSSLVLFKNSAKNRGGGLFVPANVVITATNVYVNENSAYAGAGIFAIDSTVQGTFLLENNQADGNGGGVAVSGKTFLETLTMDTNYARNGGGLAVLDGVLTARNLNIRHGTARFGGGIYLMAQTEMRHSNLLVRECDAYQGGGLYVDTAVFAPVSGVADPVKARFYSNTARSLGGGVYIEGQSTSVSQVEIIQGTAPEGGGLAASNATNCLVKDTVISDSQATDIGGGILLGGGATCLIRDTRVTTCHADVSGGGLAIKDATLRHWNLILEKNDATQGGGGLFVLSEHAPVSLLPPDSLTSESTRSLVTLNQVPNKSTGANVQVECGVKCNIVNFRLSKATLADGKGGGMFVMGEGTTTVSLCLIEGNAALEGGGVYVEGAGTLVLTRTGITGNTAIASGGGVSATGYKEQLTSVDVTQCVIYANSASGTGNGGGLTLNAATLRLIKSFVAENRVDNAVDGVGGGLYALGAATVDVSESLILWNRALKGGGIAAKDKSMFDITQSVITGDGNAMTESWSTLFVSVLGIPYTPKKALNAVGSTLVAAGQGDLIYVTEAETEVYLTSSTVSYGNAGSGGGVFCEKDAFIQAEESVLEYNFAKESGGSITLSESAQAFFMQSTVRYSESLNFGGGIFLQSSGRAVLYKSQLLNNRADDSGGGLYLDTGENVEGIVMLSEVRGNQARGLGSGVYVGRDANFTGIQSSFVANGGSVTASGKNEAGGALAGVDATLNLKNCTFEANTAISGGAIIVDRGTNLAMSQMIFRKNTADVEGGAVHVQIKGNVSMTDDVQFVGNEASLGGALSLVDRSKVNITGATFHGNRASDTGGAIFIADNTTIRINLAEFQANMAKFGGAVYTASTNDLRIWLSRFYQNVASARGGALYFNEVINASTTSIECIENRAPSGGCIFWVTTLLIDKQESSPPVPCEDCLMGNNTRYDIATNTRDAKVTWWPVNVTKGVTIMELPDEESIVPLEDVNKSIAEQQFVWPRLHAVDLYGQVEVLDNTTQCAVNSVVARTPPIFQPWGSIRASKGVVLFRDATIVAEPKPVPYDFNLFCTMPDASARSFMSSVMINSCPPGYSTEAEGCVRCLKNKYSMDGLKCFECPVGARCNISARRPTEIKATEVGTTSPRTIEGFYLFAAPASRLERSCNPAKWTATDPCRNVSQSMPGANVSDIIRQCSTAPKFRDSWPPARVFSCLSKQALYTCDVEGACQSDITVEKFLAQPSANESCTDGYDQAICSVCAEGFKRAKDGSCLSCNAANKEVRSSLRWQNFVIPVLVMIAFAVAISAVRYYLRDKTEIALLAKAEADRRLKPPSEKGRREGAIVRVKGFYQEKTGIVQDKIDELKARIKKKVRALIRRRSASDAKVLFGVEVEPSSRRFPIKPGKFKIFIGFFQIFGNFGDTFVVKWSANVQNLMDISSQFNLDLVSVAGVDCVITKNYYFDFTVTLVLVIFTLAVITVYLYAGMRSYSTKLLLIPRNCIRCGLPVLEYERVRSDEASLNPLIMIRSWWRQRREQLVPPNPLTASLPGSPRSKSQASLRDEARKLKREFGMSQVKTPHLGVFHSVHKQCPTQHVLKGMMLDRTIRSNLRVWQARVKLRMNYLTYRNKCLKLYCWIALVLYPTVSKTILMIFNCQEVGNTFYMAVDRRIICYNSSWVIFGAIAMVGVGVWIVGIPFFFWVLIRLAQDRGVASRVKLMRKPQCQRLRRKWINEVLAHHEERGIVVPEMDNLDVQDEELAKYMKYKNLTDSTVEARLGFIYAEYSHDYWWFEVVDLSRKLFLSGVIIFVQNGSVEQVLLAISVCLTTMWFLLFFQPYGDHSDNLIASVTQLQLFLTLWLGVMIQLNNLNEESLIDEQLLSMLLVGTCIAVTFFGIGMILRDGIKESRRLFLEDKADRKKRIQDAVHARWRHAFNYVCYEVQIAKYGGLNFDAFSVPAMLEAFRRLRAEAGTTDPLELVNRRERLSPLESRLPEVVEDGEDDEQDE
ncbi:hypothetical protein Poli38472_000542 [Pythium oligandrum]|uniref:Uncharacterized protein n=1 Tax=Pythium oligandrum TaxID=41045 RepID=A0A8K1CCX3_PYTOL|nr:hypothetical protein Poli38472_000542 [Pythium oligandrum]|eukprot:TMW60500.1 hypothetical protein Poli38472_000542 [Pythium oligandrum]